MRWSKKRLRSRRPPVVRARTRLHGWGIRASRAAPAQAIAAGSRAAPAGRRGRLRRPSPSGARRRGPPKPPTVPQSIPRQDRAEAGVKCLMRYVLHSASGLDHRLVTRGSAAHFMLGLKRNESRNSKGFVARIDGEGVRLSMGSIKRHSRTAMPRPCGLARWVAAPGQRTRVPSAESLRVFSASPEAYRRLSPGLSGGILQAPWPNHALQPTPWIAVAFPSFLVRRG